MSTGNFRELCREYGISARVGYKWKERFEEEGLAGMRERSRRPKSAPEGLEEAVVCRIVLLKQRHPHWGARKLRALYGRQWGKEPSESSIKRVLKKAGLVKERKVRKAKEGGRINSGRKAAGVNEVWTVDFKGWWRDAEGRCEPLTVRDEYSRMVLANRALANARTETVRAVFEELFAKHGLPEAIRSDNGAPFAARGGLLGLSRLSVWWVALGIELERSRPRCPQDNGGHERLHRDIAREIEGTAYEGRQATLDEWTQEFNQERPHEALGMRTPAEVYRKSTRKWEGTPEELKYEGMISRRVQSTGMMTYEGRKYFLSTSLGRWSVGLKAGAEGKMEVYFGRLLLGHIEAESASFRAIDAGVAGEEQAEAEGGEAGGEGPPPGAMDFGADSTTGRAERADARAARPCVASAPKSGRSLALEAERIDIHNTMTH